LFIEKMNSTTGKIIIDGNSASGLGAVFAGVTVVAWYPITPSTSVVEATIEYLKRFRVTEDGKATFAVVQAEDELAAIGMVLGAGWSGARSMTATSGPGISLMASSPGSGTLLRFQASSSTCSVPALDGYADAYLAGRFALDGVSVARRYQACRAAAASVKECFDFGYAAFDLAERLQTPIFVLSDLDLGMNNWMSEPFTYPTTPLDRGKV